MQVHPDKFIGFGSEQAFQLLSEAVNNIMAASEGGFVKDPKTEQHAWWEKWDLDPASTKRKRRRDEAIVPEVSALQSPILMHALIGTLSEETDFANLSKMTCHG